jgi:hypothetical protein
VLPHNAGGWAVVTVRELPDHAVAGQPLDLAYAVRQHGVHLVPGLRGRVVARAGGLEATAVAQPARQAGHYAARLILPRGGEWTVTFHSGFGDSRTVLLPLRAVDRGSRALPPLPDAERGRRLFVAKGCVTCHTHAEGRVAGDGPGGTVGPELTGRRFPADYLARYLADPSIKPSQQGSAPGPRMPALELAPREIAALVAFINAERRLSGR